VKALQPGARTAVEEFLGRLVRTTLILGKGGVGKTTCAIGVAARLAATESTLLVSTDPAGSLGPVLGLHLSAGNIDRVEAMPGLSAMQLDSSAARSRFLARWRDVLVSILDRGTYLDVEDIGGLVDAAFPGADEIFGLLVLAELLTPNLRGSGRESEPRFERLVVDTAPTGHTLRLLSLPETFDAVVSLLESMQSKHRFMVQALTHRYRRDAADGFLDDMRRMLANLRSALADASESRAVLVSRGEPVVVCESLRYADALRGLGIMLGAVVVEALPQEWSEREKAAVTALAAVAPDQGLFGVPIADPPPTGLEAISKSLGTMVRLVEDREARKLPGTRKEWERPAGNRLDENGNGDLRWNLGGWPQHTPSPLRQLLRVLTIVGGKGGVGKTTVACALALAAVHDEQDPGEILLVSTDPAPSIGDALGVQLPRWAHDGPQAVDGATRLRAWQMDAPAAFRALRDRYQDRIDALFEGVLGRGVDVAYDRAIIRDLLALAPPGIDELYALASLGDALAEGRYTHIIVDPAQTGHLLRLLELPALAIDWSHRLMRLIMKYKAIVGLGDAAADLVSFSQRTRALDALLHDATRAGVVLVSLDESIVIAETARLATALRRTHVAVVGEVWNRADDGTDAEHQAAEDARNASVVGTPLFVAPRASGALIGVEAIREWSRRWVLQQSGPS